MKKVYVGRAFKTGFPEYEKEYFKNKEAAIKWLRKERKKKGVLAAQVYIEKLRSVS